MWIGGRDEIERPKGFDPKDRVWVREPNRKEVTWLNFDKKQPDNRKAGTLYMIIIIVIPFIKLKDYNHNDHNHNDLSYILIFMTTVQLQHHV